MGDESSDIDFALIGHQDTWDKIQKFINETTGRELNAEKISEVYSYIPPRPLFDIEIKSITGAVSKGRYIETFISPDELGQNNWIRNISKVRAAAECAKNSKAKICGLGGFTSIVLEGKVDMIDNDDLIRFTTGNTLTAVFIVKGVENACDHFDKLLCEQNILIIGATGDIGSACVEYFSQKANKLLLCSRQVRPLAKLEEQLTNRNVFVTASTDVNSLIADADIIICTASSMINDFDFALCKADVFICDAGYPKNLASKLPEHLQQRVFCGGMGEVKAGYKFTPAIHHDLYRFPFPNIAHGCMLEAVVLAFENMQLSFSEGRGNILTENMELIYSLAAKHGITEASLSLRITADKKS